MLNERRGWILNSPIFSDYKKTGGKTLDKIRIYLQSYDHKLLDQSAKKIAEVAKKNGSELAGPLP